MYTIKCPFCPEYYNSSKPHNCNGTLAHIQKQSAEALANDKFVDALSKIPNKQSVKLFRVGDVVTVRSARLLKGEACEGTVQSVNPTNYTIQFHPGISDHTQDELTLIYEINSPESETSAKPARYNKGPLEVWDAIEKLQFNYMQGNVLKYISRYKDKKGPEDLVKAINYIVKMISQETGTDYYELHKLSPEELAKRIKK